MTWWRKWRDRLAQTPIVVLPSPAVAVWGPWADHAFRCSCRVCK